MTSRGHVERLVAVMARLRRECPWDARQTHDSLVQYLIEETAEAVEAIESGDADHLREELGDLLLQVIFHAEIAAESDPDFTLDAVAAGIADKLVRRHPYVFADGTVPDDLMGSWEARKAEEKGRASAVDGIPDQLSALARAHKMVSRARSRGVELPVYAAAAEPIAADELGAELLRLVARAQVSGMDPDQALRAVTRRLESDVRMTEANQLAS